MASGIEAADVFPVVSMSRPITTVSGRPSCLANSSMMRMFAWCGTKAARSEGWMPAASMACRATFTISQTAHRKTVGPSWRRVGQGAAPSRKSVSVAFMPTASALDPSDPQMVGPMPGVSLGPITTAPAPSPSRNEMLRSVGSTMSLSFSAPTTTTCFASPPRMSASAWPTPYAKPAHAALTSYAAAGFAPIRSATIAEAEGVCFGLLIVATISNPKQTPSASAIVADRIGANPAAAYDVNAACAGFAYGVGQADALIRGGLAKHVVVVGAEKLSDIVDPTDRSISFLLGDGAGAVVIGPSDTPGIGPTIWGSDGSKADAVGMNATLTDFRDGAAPWPTLRQEGPTVFRWAVWEMVKVARQAIEAAGIQPSDLAAFVPHQANMRIIDEFAKQLGLPETVVIGRDIETTGNTSAASIPLATHRLLEEHPELSGGLALQIGFGAGLVFGAQVVVLP